MAIITIAVNERKRLSEAQYLPVGDSAVSLVISDRLDRHIDAHLAALAGRLRRDPPQGFLAAVPALSSLLVTFDALSTDLDSMVASIGAAAAETSGATVAGRSVVLPACYDPRLAPDLAAVCSATGLGPEEVATLHAGAEYHVHMVGFLPGFAYLGGVPRLLQLPRRRRGRVVVPARSLALAAEMTAVYTVDSPGGWNIIGAVAADLFDIAKSPPSLLTAGDRVRFEPVDHDEFERLSAALVPGRVGGPT